MSAYEGKQPPRWTTSWPEWYGIEGNTQVVPASDYDALADSVEAVERDAAMYRLIRANGDHDVLMLQDTPSGYGGSPYISLEIAWKGEGGYTPEKLDAAVLAAITEQADATKR